MKCKGFFALLLVSLLAIPTAVFAAEPTPERTSAIEAHSYNVTYATMAQLIAADLHTPTDEQMTIYDLNFDDRISVDDATLIQLYCAGLLDFKTEDYYKRFRPKPSDDDPTIPSAAEPTEPPTSVRPPELPTEIITDDPVEPATTEPEKQPTYVQLDMHTLELSIYESYVFTVSTDAKRYTFSSSDESVLRVTNEGRILPQSTGEALVRCTAENGMYDSCMVVVGTRPRTLAFDAEQFSFGVGERGTLTVKTESGSAALKKVYASDNEQVVSVQSSTGDIRALSVGTAEITCTLADGLQASCTVTVGNMAESVSLNKTEITLYPGETFQLSSTIPGGTVANNRYYFSENPLLVSVTRSGGLMTAKSVGATRVYCELQNGVRAYANVTVTEQPKEFTVTPDANTTEVGTSVFVTVRDSAGAAVNTAQLTWTFSNNNLKLAQTASGKAELLAMKRGDTTVTVSNALGCTRTFQVTVADSAVLCLDISTWQGDYVDFERVKADGVSCVIIRLGFGREYDQMDSRFVMNYNKAKAAGMKVGVYWFSYATAADEAYLEADACLHCLGGRQLDMPIFYDLEYEPAIYNMSGSEYTQMAVNFCTVVRQNGYRAGVYSSAADWDYLLYTDTLRAADISIWNAHWASYTPIDCDIWQFTENGTVDGVDGYVDLSLIYNLWVVE